MTSQGPGRPPADDDALLAGGGGGGDGKGRPRRAAAAARAPRVRRAARPFHEQVLAAARRVPEAGRFGGNKAFISHVHAAHQAHKHNPRMSLGQFKERIRSERAGPLGAHLARADLVQAMGAADVAASEVAERSGGHTLASWHFIRVPARRRG